MRLIIAGCREFTHLSDELIPSLLKTFNLEPEQIVCGMANGVDMAGEWYADQNKIILVPFHPDWNKYGTAAGPIRNKEMANYADALLLIWDGESKGSASMKAEMKKLDKPIYEVILREHE